MALSDRERARLERELETLRVEHRDLDDVIDTLQQMASPDQLQIGRFKKRKLLLKDRISQIESLLIPNILA